jgi:transcription elongation factor GreA
MEEGFVLTRDGYNQIQRELDEILSVKRPEVVNRIREARQLGDLSENFDYEDAKRSQAMLDAKIKELKAILAHATVIDPTVGNGSVGIGSKVVVKDLEDGMEDQFTIVGPAESSPSEGKISLESCVGSELMGKMVGDQVVVETPGGIIKFEVVSVE